MGDKILDTLIIIIYSKTYFYSPALIDIRI